MRKHDEALCKIIQMFIRAEGPKCNEFVYLHFISLALTALKNHCPHITQGYVSLRPVLLYFGVSPLRNLMFLKCNDYQCYISLSSWYETTLSISGKKKRSRETTLSFSKTVSKGWEFVIAREARPKQSVYLQ